MEEFRNEPKNKKCLDWSRKMQKYEHSKTVKNKNE